MTVCKEHRGGSTQAEDVAEQHQVPPCQLEGADAESGVLSTVPRAEAAAHGLPDLRYLQPATGSHSFLRLAVAVRRDRGKEDR